jgi:hypothetical protein
MGPGRRRILRDGAGTQEHHAKPRRRPGGRAVQGTEAGDAAQSRPPYLARAGASSKAFVAVRSALRSHLPGKQLKPAGSTALQSGAHTTRRA